MRSTDCIYPGPMTETPAERRSSRYHGPSAAKKFTMSPLRSAAVLLLAGVTGILSGCGSGGYAGVGIASLSKSTATIDAGQSFGFTANNPGGLPIAWAVTGANCSGAACGTVTSTDSAGGATYTAPASVAKQMTVAVSATTAGTSDSKLLNVTVNPALELVGSTPSGVVGIGYKTFLGALGGSAPVKLSIISDKVPTGLTFDPVSGEISGVPSQVGTYAFTMQAVDSSDAPAPATYIRTIFINATGAPVTVASGNPPAGVVGTSYTTTLQATGGTAPYTWVLSSGSLPAGLTLASTGVISGTPTTAGNSNFSVTATDSANTSASASFNLPVTASGTTPGLTITSGTLPDGTVNQTYNNTVAVSGGTAPYTCSVASGSLPAGLSFTTGCTVFGAPTTVGTSTLTVRAVDSSNPSASTIGNITININPTPLSAGSGTLPDGTVNTAYSATIPVTGGVAPYTCKLVTGTFQAGLTLNANCSVTGTPTAVGTSTPTVTIKDSSPSGLHITPTISLTIKATTLTAGTGTLPPGTVGTVYSAPIPVSGGTGPYTCSLTSGTLPAGLTLSGCTVTGTPTTPGTSTPTITITDGSSPPQTITPTISLTINPAALSVGNGTLPNGTVGILYSQTIPVTGGTSPYTCALASGSTLPAGLSLAANCTVSGTPTTAGSSAPVVTISDSSNPAQSFSPKIRITINPATLAVSSGTLPAGTVGTVYSATIPVTGGTTPYTCTVTSGTLPAGLSLGAGCTVTGTPTTAGTSTPTITVTDGSSPPQTITPTISITINPAALSVGNGTLPNGTVGVLYSQTIPVTGGTAPYTCALASGTLPDGLTIAANCTVSGTPTTAGASAPVITITDSSSPAQSFSPKVRITINPAALTVSSGTLPAGTVGVTYSQTIPVNGGTTPYTCTVTSGTLPAGLAIGAGCTVTGTPTAAGTSTPTITITDASNPAQTITPTISITINPAALTVTSGTLPGGTVGVTYNQTVPVAGGTAPYTCTVASGSLPAGLAFGAGCTVTGTPTTAGTSTPTITIKDSGNPQKSINSAISITISPAPLVLGTGGLPNGTVGTLYTQTFPVSGGTSPYTCSLGAGTLPAGLSLGAGCTVTGTPTTAGTSTPTINVTDSSNPALTTSGQVSITIDAAPVTIVIASPPPATLNVSYTGSVPVSGGTGPYTCQVNSGSVPGLTINANCSITGTPTATGSTPINVTVKDSSSPANSKTGTTTITVNAPTVTLTLTAPATATVTVPYTGTIGVTGGTAPYTCSANPASLPAGLTLNSNCTVTGTPTAVAITVVNVTATDSANPANTNTAPVTITVQAIQPLVFTGSLDNATVGVAYSQTLAASGGVGPYTYTLKTGTLPAGLSLASNGTVSGTPTAAGASSFTITATDAEATPQTKDLAIVLLVVYPTTPNDALLKGPYAYLFQGNDDILLSVLSYRTATVGSFTADGTGVVSAGEMDSNHQTTTVAGNTISTNSFIGTYTVGSDLRGSLTLSALAADGTVASNTTYSITLKAAIAPATVSATVGMVLTDTNSLGGTKGSGSMLLQDSTKFATGLSGSYAFGLQGDSPCTPTCTVGLVAGPVVSVGQLVASGNTITGVSDANIASTTYAKSVLGGSYTSADTNGRVQLAMTSSLLAGGAFPTDYAVYVVDANNVFMLSTDKHSSYILQAGTAMQQTQTTFSNASLNTSFLGYENSPVNPGLVGSTLQNVANLSTATIFRGTADAAGNCTVTNVDTGGTAGLVNALTGIGSGSQILNALLGTYQSLGTNTCAVEASGRVTLNYPAPSGLLPGILGILGLPSTPPPARIVYLYGANRGYFLESGYAGLGMLEKQTGAPYSTASLNGTYVYDSIPPSTIATIDATGSFTADGAGNATSNLDENVGVGTLNVLQLNVPFTTTYTLTDATAGRYTLGTYGIIYGLIPGKFILLQSDAVGTSPYIALLF